MQININSSSDISFAASIFKNYFGIDKLLSMYSRSDEIFNYQFYNIHMEKLFVLMMNLPKKLNEKQNYKEER